MEPIATYSEVRFDGARTFTLFPDRIIVRGKQTLHSDFETTIPLATLDANFDRLSIRNRNFASGIWLAIISFGLSGILLKGLKMSLADFMPLMLFVVGFAGLILAAATFRKVEFLRFKNQAGVVVLDVARSGKQIKQFGPFIDALVRQIEVSKAGPPT